jgi:hypothetical protein
MDQGKFLEEFSLVKKQTGISLPRPISDEDQTKFGNELARHESNSWSEEDFIRLLGRKWKTQLEVLGVVIEEYKYITSRTLITKLYISVTSKNLLRIFKNIQTVSRVLKLAQKIGLLICVKRTYDSQNHNSRAYIWNKNVQDLVLRLIKKHHISIQKSNFWTNHVAVSVPNKTIQTLLHSRYRLQFSSKLRIPTKISGIVINEAAVFNALYHVYPYLQSYQKRMDKINLSLQPMEKIIFTPKITISKAGKYITKIGIRASSYLCNLKSERKQNANDPEFIDTAYRETYLNSIFSTKPYHYDVSSSIAKVTYLVNFGEWPEGDLYPLMANLQFSSKKQREGYKNLFMRLYFDNPNLIYQHNKILLKQFAADEVKQYIKDLRQQMEAVIGPSLDSEVFFHESCIYFDVFETLVASGARVIQVYDSFWWTGGSYDLTNIESLVQLKAEEYCQKYLSEV